MDPSTDRDGKMYEAPRVTDHGDLTELTAGQSTGRFTDQTFPTNTPFEDLTFTTPR